MVLHILAESSLADDPQRWPDLHTEAQGVCERFWSPVLFADTGEPMRMLFATRTPLGVSLPPLSCPEGNAVAAKALATGRPVVGDIFVGTIAEAPQVAIAVPGARGARGTHLLLTIFETRQLQQCLDQEAFPAEWSMTLKDGKGDIIARRAPAHVDPLGEVDDNGRFVVNSSPGDHRLSGTLQTHDQREYPA